MPNPYFQFKQFIIHQDQCAMKVCTDACILGAWFSEKISSYSLVLDIGSGTGLLMLMLAQKHNGEIPGGEIHGIELEPDCFEQLRDNIQQSKWKDKLQVFPGDTRSFVFPNKYDFIISNPPFFEGELNAEAETSNLAKHSKELTLSALMETIDANLAPAGSFGILLPYHRTEYFEGLARSRHFHLREKLLVRQSPRHSAFRTIQLFSRNKESFAQVTELVIKNEHGDYTEEFTELLKDYYLYL